MPCLFSACFANNSDSSFFASLEKSNRGGLSFWEFFPFSLVSYCCTLQFSPLYSPVATTMVFQEYSISAIRAWYSYSRCCYSKTINAFFFLLLFFFWICVNSKWIKTTAQLFCNNVKKKKKKPSYLYLRHLRFYYIFFYHHAFVFCFAGCRVEESIIG